MSCVSIFIDKEKCVSCGRCKEVCPGNLIRMDENNKAYIRDVRDCWGCTSCLKECGQGAVHFFLGADIGGMGSTLAYERFGDIVNWIVTMPTGEQRKIQVDASKANAY